MRLDYCWDSSDGCNLSYVAFREQFQYVWVATKDKGFRWCRVNPIKMSDRHVTLRLERLKFAGCTVNKPNRTEIYMTRFATTQGAGLQEHMFTVCREAGNVPFRIQPTENFVELVKELALAAQSDV